MNRFDEVKGILDTAVGGPDAEVSGPHGPFWRELSRDEFVEFSVFGLAVVTLGNGDDSTLIKALRGQEPFGEDIGTAGATFRRMPAGLPPVPEEGISLVARWIDDGCPGEVPSRGGVKEQDTGHRPSGY
jgi:hypothetical protein